MPTKIEIYWSKFYEERERSKYRANICQKSSIIRHYLRTGYTRNIEIEKAYRELLRVDSLKK